nr:ParB N-terminal domain-containing protein [Pseudosulfitobacter pseudonitzschiae]
MVSEIKVGDRHRKDMGDLTSLADSIAALGLLQPIGIAPDNTLIFGERRLRACRDVLGLVEIEVRVIDMPSIVVGENAENEVRKDFTPSERVAIARAIADEIGGRQGQRTDMELPQNIAEVSKGQETREFAAKKAGFGNRETFRQAEAVTERAAPELVEAMDTGKVSIFAAHKALRETPERQVEVARTGRSIADQERRNDEDRRRQAMSEPIEVKIQTVTEAAASLAHCGISPEEFRRVAPRLTYQRFQRSAIGALAFLKALTEVENDQERTG